MSGLKRQAFDLDLGGATLCLGRRTKLMGVLNVTPDSFSDGGLYLDTDAALRRALQMEEEGADILDIGGESSRPGARPVSVKEEIRRIRPVLKRLAKKIKIPISVDTYKYDVALAALDEGARIVNDIYALGFDRRMGKLIARYRAAVVLMHMRGNPETMQKNIPAQNVLKTIRDFLEKAAARARAAGIPPSRVILDPGFGFGKTAAQNLEILSHLDTFLELKQPLLVGLSRKSFIGDLLGRGVDARLTGSLAAAGVAIHRGAHLLRVHDVRAHRELCALTDAALDGEGTGK